METKQVIQAIDELYMDCCVKCKYFQSVWCERCNIGNRISKVQEARNILIYLESDIDSVITSNRGFNKCTK